VLTLVKHESGSGQKADRQSSTNWRMPHSVFSLDHHRRGKRAAHPLRPMRAILNQGLPPAMLGFFFGLMPGRGALVAGFASYMLKKKISRSPECLGKGAIEGVAGPESANNAAAQASPRSALAFIPANAVIGIVMGALLMQNVVPGPQILT
jgi:TctA family transporter